MTQEHAANRSTGGQIERALDAFRSDNPVLIHDFDDREGEIDLIYPAKAVTPEAVARLRNDAGGLVCVAVPDQMAAIWNLPFLADVIDHPSTEGHDLSYDERSSFSLTVNHRDAFTGITDRDRALTITKLAATVDAVAGDADHDAEDFAANFRSPGHVHLLRAAPGLLDERQGHTELGLALADTAGVTPAVVVCEMLDDETGGARSTASARDYAERMGYPFLEGDLLVDRLG